MPSHQAMETATRLGFAARAVLYILLGWIALRSGRGEGGAEALEYIEGGAGRILLAIMAVGFLAYGLWRLIEAAVDSEGHGNDAKGVAIRIGGTISGIVHLGLGAYAIQLAAGSGGDAAEGGGAREGAATALALPGGYVLVAIAAAALLATGAYQLIKAAKGSFLKHLEPQAAGQAWVKWVGRAGYAARGIVFLVIAWTVWRAAQEGNAGRAGDMGTAVDMLSGPLKTVVAAGLLLFGIFSAIEAIYRRINNPHVIDRLRSNLPA